MLGLIKNEHLTLKELNICSGAKLMLVGSTLKDVLNVNLPSKETPKQTEVTQSGMYASCYIARAFWI